MQQYNTAYFTSWLVYCKLFSSKGTIFHFKPRTYPAFSFLVLVTSNNRISMLFYSTLTLREPRTDDLFRTASSTDSSWGNLNLLALLGPLPLFPNSESLPTSLKGGLVVAGLVVAGGGVAVGAAVEAPPAAPVTKKSQIHKWATRKGETMNSSSFSTFKMHGCGSLASTEIKLLLSLDVKYGCVFGFVWDIFLLAPFSLTI